MSLIRFDVSSCFRMIKKYMKKRKKYMKKRKKGMKKRR
jgi:hypothetical protein